MAGYIIVYSRDTSVKEENLKKGFETRLGREIPRVKILSGYLIDVTLTDDEMEIAATRLFTDPVVEDWARDTLPWPTSTATITTGYKPGVTDNVGHTASKALRDLGIAIDQEGDFVHSFKVHVLWDVTVEEAKELAGGLYNPIVEFANVSPGAIELPDYDLSSTIDESKLVTTVPLTSATDDELMEISRKGLLALNLEEMKKIQEHYRALRREPTDIELETFAQTWSEHCVHKTLKGRVSLEITRRDGTRELLSFENLIKETIFKATTEIRKNAGQKDICVSVFKDNAGIIKFNDKYNICFKVETHNHPSAKEPYGGAATGIGGVIRDILAAGVGAKPFANTDVFCLAPPFQDEKQIPEGIIHPMNILKGIVAGVRDYGNPMGIPTVNGALFFDERYLGNPLVYCGTAGIIPREILGRPTEQKEVKVGDHLVFVGGKTGRDGIHGVTFASLEMDKHTSSNPVQIGDPITERMFMEAMFKVRNEGLYNFVQDCGGGGLSSAFGEMSEKLGCVIDLDRVPLKYTGLLPWEIWISESQERQAFSVPPENLPRFQELFNREDVDVYDIGEVTGNKRLVLRYNGKVIGDIDVEFLHEGVPKASHHASWTEPPETRKFFPAPANLAKILHSLLRCLNICSKEWVVRQYDSEVQGGTVTKPLQGLANQGPGDGAVLKPDLESNEGVVLSNGMNPKYGDIDPYWMAASGIDEAIRNAVCCGGNPEHLAILDNFCWGNPDNPDQMAKLVLACIACRDIAVPFGTPFISGKDSLNNEYKTDDGVISIPPSLLISAIGKVDDIRKVPSTFLKNAGNPIYIIGTTREELGGSHYLEVIGQRDKNNVVPRVYPGVFKKQYLKIHQAIKEGLVISAHDCAEGGLGVAISEMAIDSDKGAKIDLSKVPVEGPWHDVADAREKPGPRDDIILFSESNGRILVEVPRGKEDAFKALMHANGIACDEIGQVIDDQRLVIVGLSGETIIDEEVHSLRESWLRPLDLEGNLLRRGDAP